MINIDFFHAFISIVARFVEQNCLLKKEDYWLKIDGRLITCHLIGLCSSAKTFRQRFIE